MRKKFKIFAAVVTLVFLFFLIFGRGNNLIHWIEAKREISRNRGLIEQRRRELERMDIRIESLSADRDSIEKFAREHYHFSEHGDDVYLIDEK